MAPIPEERYSKLLDQIYNVMRQSPVSPKEFIEAFNNSRRIALSEGIEPEIYFERLQDALEIGVSPDEMYEYLLEKSAD